MSAKFAGDLNPPIVPNNAQEEHYRQMLQAASEKGDEKAVQMLLTQGANVNAQGGHFGSALQAASSKGHDKVVQMLLAKGANVNAQGGAFGNALQAASEGGHEKVVQMLLTKGANVNAQGGHFGSALQAASSKGHDKVVQMLLAKGANVNAQGGAFGNALQAASEGGHEKVVQMLLTKGANVNAQSGALGNALQAASSKGHDKEVVQILLSKGANVNAQGGAFGNALQAASEGGHDKVVQMLLTKGANVNAQGGLSGNALQAASEGGHDKVVQMLLTKGANVNAQGGLSGNALQAASSRGHEKVVHILLSKGANVNAQGGLSGSALQAASEGGHEKVVQMLLAKGANVNAQGGLYGSALQAASSGGHEKMVQILLANGANVNTESERPRLDSLFATSFCDGSALQAASSKGHNKVVQTLLAKGADVNAQGGHHGNALQAASVRGYDEVVQTLLAKGATDCERRQETKMERGKAATGPAKGGLLRPAASESVAREGPRKKTLCPESSRKEVEQSAKSLKGLPSHLEDDSELEVTGSAIQGNALKMARIVVDEAFQASHSSAKAVTLVYDCKWMVTTVVRGQYDPSHSLSDIVTLTGKLDQVQAATCSEYVSNVWPEAGQFLLETLSKYLNVPASVEWPISDRSKQISIKKISEPSAGLGSTLITVTAYQESHLQILTTLAWLAATVRATSFPISCSKIDLGYRPAEDPGLNGRLHVCLSELEPFEPGANNCWLKLFQNFVVAEQFPIAKRSLRPERGLEISSALMVMLAGIVLSVDYQGGSILRGLSTALIPIKVCKDGQGRPAIQWHLLVSDSLIDEDFEKRLRNTIKSFLKVDDALSLLGKSAYLGWCEHASILLGTNEIRYDLVNWSGKERVSMRPQLTGFSVTGGTGGLGFLSCLGTLNFAMAKNQRSRYITGDPQPLTCQLKIAAKKSCLLYDSTTSRAWLVPTTCLLVHMLHLRLRILGQNHELAPFSSIDGNAGHKAEETLLYCKSSPTLQAALEAALAEKAFEDTLNRFCVALSALEKDSHAAQNESGESLICAYELLDVVESNNLHRFSPQKKKIFVPGLEKITRGDGGLGYILRCSGLGEVMIPRDRPNGKLCSNCISVPCGLNYLSAYIPCISELLQKQGRLNACQDLDEREINGKAIFQICKPKCLNFQTHHVHHYEDFTASRGMRNIEFSPTSLSYGAIVLNGQRRNLKPFRKLKASALRINGAHTGRYLEPHKSCGQSNKNVHASQNDEVAGRDQRLPRSLNAGAANNSRTLPRHEKID